MATARVEPRPSAASCATHAAAAGWECIQCHRLLCPDCVARVEVQQHYRETFFDCCVLCDGFAKPLFVPGASAPFSVQFSRTLLVSVRWYGLAIGIAIAFGMGVSRHLSEGALAATYLLGILPAFWPLFFAATRAAWASSELASLKVEALSQLLRPSLRAWLLSASVFALCAAIRNLRPEIRGAHADPAIWAVILLLSWLTPSVLVGLAGDDGVLQSISPADVARRIRAIGLDYVLAGGVTCAVGAFSLWWTGTARAGRAADIPVVPILLDAFSLYSWFIVARAVGLMLSVHGDSLGYRLGSGALIRALPDAVPRGRRRAPNQDG